MEDYKQDTFLFPGLGMEVSSSGGLLSMFAQEQEETTKCFDLSHASFTSGSA